MIYDSILVVHPDGEPMFRCSKERINWYLRRNLAIEVGHGIYKLTFTPKGKGHVGDPFYLSVKESNCVVCGNIDVNNLSKHHVVPICYRKHFPHQSKSRQFHDVVLLCIDCHRKYERLAGELKKQLESKYLEQLDNSSNRKIATTAHTLLNYREQIPQEKAKKLEDKLCELIGRVPAQDELKGIIEQIDLKKYDSGKLIVDKIQSIQEFVEMWRKHFVHSMSPKFLSPHWDINKPCRL